MRNDQYKKLSKVYRILGLIGMVLTAVGLIWMYVDDSENLWLLLVCVGVGLWAVYGMSPFMIKLITKLKKYEQERTKKKEANSHMSSTSISSADTVVISKDTKFCTECGKAIDGEAKFCNYCGKEQNWIT